MLKKMENKKLGIRIVSKRNGKIEQRVVIAHVDDADFCNIVAKISKRKRNRLRIIM